MSALGNVFKGRSLVRKHLALTHNICTSVRTVFTTSVRLSEQCSQPLHVCQNSAHNLCTSLTSSYARRDTTPQIDTVNNEIADYRSRTSAALNANTDISVLMQERLAERHRRLADIDAQIELLKQATKASGEKQQELAALRRENDGLQAVVDLVMGTLQAEGDMFDVEDDADGGGAGAASASE
jgi:hypothetical protein